MTISFDHSNGQDIIHNLNNVFFSYRTFPFLKKLIFKLIFINLIICGKLIHKEGPSHQLLGLNVFSPIWRSG